MNVVNVYGSLLLNDSGHECCRNCAWREAIHGSQFGIGEDEERMNAICV